MSKRWTYQIKIGLFWGFFMTLFSVLFELEEKTIARQFSENKFYIKLLANLLVGIFVMGFLFWKGQDPKNNSWGTFFKKKQ